MIARLELDILVDFPAWLAAVPTAEALCRRAALAAFDATATAHPQAGAGTEAEASVVLSNDARVKMRNAAWRGKNEATNVLAFPAMDLTEARPQEPQQQPPLMIGDIIVAFETAAAEATLEGKNLSDHLSHLVVHGMLHLLGYDHRTAIEAEEMESLEVAVLASIGVADPYSVASIDPK
jgi:probable rRNA maturation factor